MNRPAGSAFPSEMFRPMSYSGPSVNGWASRKQYNNTLKPAGLKNPGINIKKTASRITGSSNVNVAKPLVFGGTRRKGGKRSKTRRVTRRQR